jgi:hypothetical protein
LWSRPRWLRDQLCSRLNEREHHASKADLPADISRETPVPVNNVGAGRCPVCNGSASIAPMASEYRGK